MIDYEVNEKGLHNLSCGIVKRAVDDWRMLIKRKEWLNKPANGNKPAVSFDEIRRFFNSDWAEVCLFGSHIAPETILEKLEKELADAKEKHEKERKKRGLKGRTNRH